MNLEGQLKFMVSIGLCIYAANKERKETRKGEGKRGPRVWATINTQIHSFYMYIHQLPPPHILTNLPVSQVGR